MRGIFDIGRPRRARHGAADRLADHFVGLVGIFDGAGIFHRILDERFLAHELDAASAHAALGDTGALAAKEDDRRIFNQAALDGGHEIGHARPQRADADGGLAGDAAGGFGHKAAGGLVMRRNHGPAALFCFEEHMHEVGVWDTEQRVDALGLEQFEDALVDGGAA